jgi:hypothetical protein
VLACHSGERRPTDPVHAPSDPAAAEPGTVEVAEPGTIEAPEGGTVRHVVQVHDRRVAIDLPQEVASRYAAFPDVQWFELGWKISVGLRKVNGPAPSRIPLNRVHREPAVVDEGVTDDGFPYSVQTFSVRVGDSKGGRSIHWYEEASSIIVTLALDERTHVECTGTLGWGVDAADGPEIQTLLDICTSMTIVE